MSEASLDVAALRAALAKATPGPWRTAWDQQEFYIAPESDVRDPWSRVAEWTYAILPGNSIQQGECDTDDAELIVLLRNNAEALLDALAASEAKVAKFDNILDQYTNGKISKVACVSLMLNAADS